MPGFTTRLLHGAASKKDPHGALRMPIYDCAAFEFDTAESIGKAFAGTAPGHTYSRGSNPTVEFLEQRIAGMSGARGAVAVASGMAAISNVILALCESGSSIVTSPYLFANTFGLYDNVFIPWGLNVRYAESVDAVAIQKAIDTTTRLVFIETLSNPQLIVADIAAIAKVCHERNIPLVLDNTLATPYVCNTKLLGADIEIISSTKYFSGGGTSIGGCVIDNGVFDWQLAPRIHAAAPSFGKDAFLRTLRRNIFRNTGACLSPHAAHLQTLGLETLALRIDRSSENALGVAQFLENHAKVQQVNYPGLTTSLYHNLASSQFFKGMCGGLLSFELSSREDCMKFLNALKLIYRATNLNDNKSLAIHPASTIYCDYSAEQLSTMKVSQNLIRLSVGIEDCADILADLTDALSVL